MKDRHDIILILVSSKWLIPFSRVVHHIIFSVRDALSFLSQSSKFSRLYRREASSKSPQGFTLCFQLPFLFYHHFITRVLHGGSTWSFVKGFFSFFNCSSRFLLKLWSAKLYSKINMVLNTCFVLRSSSILHLASKVQYFLPNLLRWCYVTLDMFHDSSYQEWDI